MSDIAIKVDNLRRSFGKLKAVDGVTFEIPKGSVCGFVGANGAGKTTTMRMLATLDYPSSGTIEVAGYNVIDYPEKVRNLLGWMPDHFGNYKHMSVLEYIDFYARAYGFSGKEREERVREVMEFTDLISISDMLSNKLSKGMTQRLCLGRTLLHDPEVLILDEPAAGLDPKARVELKHLIRILAEEGKTIFISSHILTELGEMCDSLLFLNKGRIVHHGDANSLKRRTASDQGAIFNVHFLNELAEVKNWIETSPYVTLVEAMREGAKISINSQDDEQISEVLHSMFKGGLKVTEFHREQQNLEDAFIDMLGELESPSNLN